MRPTTILLTCGVAAGVLVPALILTDGATRPGYSLWHHGASQLGTGQRGWLQTVNFVIGGLLLLAFAAGLRRVLCRAPQPGRAAIWGPILLAAAGLALAVAGIVPTDPALGYPPGRPEVITATGRVHGLAGLGLFATLAATPFVLARPCAAATKGGWPTRGGRAPWSSPSPSPQGSPSAWMCRACSALRPPGCSNTPPCWSASPGSSPLACACAAPTPSCRGERWRSH